MGRYSSVQAFADNSSNVRSVSYEQAKGTGQQSSAAASADANDRKFIPPEKVVNPYGSTAGAGSGEFHVYRQARAREMERIQKLEGQREENAAEATFKSEVAQNQAEADRKTAKNRKKRQREKEAKMRKKNLAQLTGKTDDNSTSNKEQGAVDEDEFSYIPMKEKDKNADSGEEKDQSRTSAETMPGGSAGAGKAELPVKDSGEDDGEPQPKKSKTTTET